MNIGALVETMIILFGMLVTGVIAQKLKIITDEVSKKLSELIVKITSPALIVGSVCGKEISGDRMEIIYILGLGIIFYLINIIISILIIKPFKLNKGDKEIYELMVVFTNTGFVGIPVVKVLYGDYAILYLTILHISFNVLMYSYGIYKMNRYGGNAEGFDIKKIANAGVISAVLGLIIYLLNIPIPKIAGDYLMVIGEMTIPLSMMLLGASLATIPIKNIFKSKKIYIFCFVKLVVLPIFFYFLSSILLENQFFISLITISAGLPAASMIVMFAIKYEKNVEISSLGVFLTTFFSMITIPLIVYLLLR